MSYNGQLFDDSLNKNIQSLIDRVEMNKAAMLIIDGGVGEGKTTLAVEIAEHIQPDFFKHKEKLVAMGGKEFLKALEIAVKEKHKVIIYDEAGDFNSRGALSWFNQNLNRVFETYRQTKIIVILCLPFFIDVDTSLFKKGIPRMLIHTYNRNNWYGRYKVYSLYRTWYLRYWARKMTIPQMCFSKTHANQRGQFKDLPPEKAQGLADLSIKGKKIIIQQAYIKSKGLISVDEIVRQTGKARGTVYHKLTEFGAEAEKVGKNNFYPKNVLDQFYK